MAWLGVPFGAGRLGDQSGNPRFSKALEGGRVPGARPRGSPSSARQPGTRSPRSGNSVSVRSSATLLRRPRAPGRGRAKGGCKDGAEWARASTCSVARGPTFPREPALGSLTWGVPVAGAGCARQVWDDGGGGGERRLDGLAEGPQAAQPGPAPRSRPL